MARLVFVVLILAVAGHSSATWCVCKQGLSDAALQKTLDYACGAGADCNLIHQNGVCYNPNTVLAHCNYAVNSYFQRKGQATGSCDFAGTAAVAASDPSTAGCVYPSSASAAGTITTPGTTTPSNNTPSGSSPYVTTPNGGLGGIGTGIGPSGVGINTDSNHGGFSLQKITGMFSFLITLLFSVLLMWG